MKKTVEPVWHRAKSKKVIGSSKTSKRKRTLRKQEKKKQENKPMRKRGGREEKTRQEDVARTKKNLMEWSLQKEVRMTIHTGNRQNGEEQVTSEIIERRRGILKRREEEKKRVTILKTTGGQSFEAINEKEKHEINRQMGAGGKRRKGKNRSSSTEPKTRNWR